MKDNYISGAAVIAGTLWAIAGGLVATTWIMAIRNDVSMRTEGAMGLTAVLCMALASICQVRFYVLRLCGLIRVSAGLETPEGDVHPIR